MSVNFKDNNIQVGEGPNGVVQNIVDRLLAKKVHFNVIMDFTENQNSCKFVPNKNRGFKGTLYSWQIDSTCYQK